MASKYPFPGVWTQRVERPQPPRELSPSSMAVIGYTLKGPVNQPERISSWNEFIDRFGGLTDLSYVPMSVFEFYENGGQYVYPVRVVPSGSLTASATIDTPTKWTMNMQYAGAYGNNIAIDIAGNESYLNRTTYAWDRFDIYVLEPDDDGNLVASEFFEAVQFTDSSAVTYVTRVVGDPERGSALVTFVVGLGGTPVGLTSTTVTDEIIGTGASPQTQFTATLANIPVLTSTLQIVAPESAVDDQAQTTTPAINGTQTAFAFTLPSSPVMDGSVRLFFQRLSVANEVVPPDSGLINGVNKDFVFNAGNVDNPVHRENAVFRLKYAGIGGASGPNTLFTDPGPGGPYDLSLNPIALALPVHPGSLTINIDIGAGPVAQYDDGAGNFPVTAELPAGATINYDTGALTGTTGALLGGSSVTEGHYQSSVITKAASADNMAQGVSLTGAVDGAGTNTINLVDSVASPTTSGAIDVKTQTAPQAGFSFYIDYIALGIINDDLDGNLTGDVGAPVPPTYMNIVDFETGDASIVASNPPLNGSTLDADYYTGQIVEDDGLGHLTGDVDLSGNNTIDYETGAVDVTFATAPPTGGNVLANYVKLEDRLRFQLSGGTDGTGVITRNEVSAPALEASGGGMYALKDVEDIFQLAIPDFAGSATVARDQLTFAESIKRAFAVLATPSDLSAAEAKEWRFNTLGTYSRWGAVYYPWLYVRNPNTGYTGLLPPIGTVCGIYARTDSTRNVGKAPAGTEDATILGAVGPEYRLGDDDLETIFDSGMNALRSSDATGFSVWGARTLERDNPDWLYINAQRLFTFLEYSAYRLSHFIVFGNNGPALWKRAELSLFGWMMSLFNQGYFAGRTPEQAFFVICDASNNNQASIEDGIVYIDIGAAPFRPAEFVVVRIAQKIREQV